MTMKNSNGKKGGLFVISAPSGAGKGTVLKQILELRPEHVLSVSFTTRSPRTGEKHGESYFFAAREDFEKMIEQDKFLEYAEYVGEYYGTPKEPIYDAIGDGKSVLLEIEVLGAGQIKEKEPDAVSIFIIPPSLEELERRLRGRGTDSDDKIRTRLERARAELEERHSYDHVVVNDDVTRAAQEIISIMDSYV